jgi:hypothetical protein
MVTISDMATGLEIRRVHALISIEFYTLGGHANVEHAGGLPGFITGQETVRDESAAEIAELVLLGATVDTGAVTAYVDNWKADVAATKIRLQMAIDGDSNDPTYNDNPTDRLADANRWEAAATAAGY